MKTLIKNGRIITAVDDYHADILIEDGKVSTIGKTLEMEVEVTPNTTATIEFPNGRESERAGAGKHRYTISM